MAEGFLNTLHGNRYEGYSAGMEPGKVNPFVIKVMKELGIDISRHRSKSIEEFRGKNFNYVVTVCDHAKEICPFFPGENILHISFKDPSKFNGTEKEKLRKTRRIRDEIRDWIETTFKN